MGCARSQPSMSTWTVAHTNGRTIASRTRRRRVHGRSIAILKSSYAVRGDAVSKNGLLCIKSCRGRCDRSGMDEVDGKVGAFGVSRLCGGAGHGAGSVDTTTTGSAEVLWVAGFAAAASIVLGVFSATWCARASVKPCGLHNRPNVALSLL